MTLPPLVWGAGGFVLGALIGSYLSTLLDRWPAGRSASFGRSRCESCDAALSPGELVPLLSFLVQRGRCLRCRAPIGRRSFVVEALAAAIGFVAFTLLPGWDGVVAAVLGWWLLLLAAFDLELLWLPDRLTLPLLAAGLLLGAAPLQDRVIGVAAGFAVLFAIGAVYQTLRGRRGLGGGDPKLFGALGAWLGWQQLPLVLVGASFIGLVAIAVTRLRGREVELTDKLPFGTLLAAAAWPLWLLTALGLSLLL
jgi:leader peptidase (prepilin peptidase)/N-methyltransferase